MQFDVIALVLMGLLVVDNSVIKLAQYAEGAESFVRAANRMMAWDSSVDLSALREWVPCGDVDSVSLRQDAADQVCKSLRDLLDGRAVDVEELSEMVTLTQPSLAEEVTASQVVPTRTVPGMSSPGLQQAGLASFPNLTQVGQTQEGTPAEPAAEAWPDEARQRKRMRSDPPLTPGDWLDNVGLKKKVLLSALKSGQGNYQRTKNKESFKNGGTPQAVEDAFHVVFRFLDEARLADQAGTGTSTLLKAPPGQHIEAVMAELVSRCGLSDGEKNKMQMAMREREVKADFSIESFLAATAKLGDSMKT